MYKHIQKHKQYVEECGKKDTGKKDHVADTKFKCKFQHHARGHDKNRSFFDTKLQEVIHFWLKISKFMPIINSAFP